MQENLPGRDFTLSGRFLWIFCPLFTKSAGESSCFKHERSHLSQKEPKLMKKRVVIVGMGFGGIHAARILAGQGADVVLVDRNNYHLFQPLLYQVATAGLEQESIAQSVRAMARNWPGTRFHLTEVTAVDFSARAIQTDTGNIAYDYLVIGAGSITNFFGLESVARHAFDLKEFADAERLRNHILTAFERAVIETDPVRKQALLTFIIVGGGPTGVEFSGALIELIHFVLAKDYPELSIPAARVLLIEGTAKLLASMPETQRTYTLQKLRSMSVEVLLNTHVVAADSEQVILDNGDIIPTHTLFWSAGVKAAPLAAALETPTKAAGRIPVSADLTLPGHPEVFVIGDMAYLEQEGAALPMTAPVATQMGTYVGSKRKGLDPATLSLPRQREHGHHRSKCRRCQPLWTELSRISGLAGVAPTAPLLSHRLSQSHRRHAQLGLVLLVS